MLKIKVGNNHLRMSKKVKLYVEDQDIRQTETTTRCNYSNISFIYVVHGVIREFYDSYSDTTGKLYISYQIPRASKLVFHEVNCCLMTSDNCFDSVRHAFSQVTTADTCSR